MNHPKRILVEEIDEEQVDRSLERCIEPKMPEGNFEDDKGFPGTLTVAVFSNEVSARKIMGLNFSGVTEYEQRNNLGKKMKSHEYISRGLPQRVPWTMGTLRSPCPFYKGRRICETHYIGLASVRKWEGSIPSSEAEYHFAWILHLIKPPIMRETDAPLVDLPEEYEVRRIFSEGMVCYIIVRKPEKFR